MIQHRPPDTERRAPCVQIAHTRRGYILRRRDWLGVHGATVERGALAGGLLLAFGIGALFFWPGAVSTPPVLLLKAVAALPPGLACLWLLGLAQRGLRFETEIDLAARQVMQGWRNREGDVTAVALHAFDDCSRVALCQDPAGMHHLAVQLHRGQAPLHVAAGPAQTLIRLERQLANDLGVESRAAPSAARGAVRAQMVRAA